MTSYSVEWVDWDDKHHHSVYVPKVEILKWNDRNQLPSDVRGKVKFMLGRIRL